MAEVTQQQVVDYIKGISVLELSQLVKTLETELGVSAAAAVAVAAPAGGGAATAAAGPIQRLSTGLQELPQVGDQQLRVTAMPHEQAQPSLRVEDVAPGGVVQGVASRRRTGPVRRR